MDENNTSTTPTSASGSRISEILFPNGNKACLIACRIGEDPNQIIKDLGIDRPLALIMCTGGCKDLEERHMNRLTQLFSRAIAKAAVDVRALIIDGGTKSGFIEMMGKGVSDRGRKTKLVGVAPKAKVSYPGSGSGSGDMLEENHTHFILVDGPDWGCETDTMWGVARTLVEKGFIATVDSMPQNQTTTDTKKEAWWLRFIPFRKKVRALAQKKAAATQMQGKISAVTVLANGGEGSKQDVLNSVRLGWPVIVIEGSGRLADQIVQNLKKDPDTIDDPIMAEIVGDGKIVPYKIDSPVEGLERSVIRLLKEDATLRMAWELFAEYDQNAERQRHEFESLQKWILILGVLATALALTKKTMQADTFPETVAWLFETFIFTPVELIFGFLHKILFFLPANMLSFSLDTPALTEIIKNSVYLTSEVLYGAILLIPIAIATLFAAANRFNAGSKWLYLRSNAEAVKRHIYRYRTQADIYNAEETANSSREARLAEKIKDIRSSVNQSDVNVSSIRPYKGPIPPRYGAAEGDDGFSPLTPEQFVTYRLDDQLHYFQGKTVKLESQLKRYQWIIYTTSGGGTLLAAWEYEWWIALTTAIVTALTTYMEYQKIEDKLKQFNQGTTDLANIRGWWMSLSSDEQARQKNIDFLVGSTEKILETEASSWLAKMQEALEELKAKQEEDDQVRSKERESAKNNEKTLEESDPAVSTANSTQITQTINSGLVSTAVTNKAPAPKSIIEASAPAIIEADDLVQMDRQDSAQETSAPVSSEEESSAAPTAPKVVE